MAYSLYAVGGSLWHNLVVCVTENDYSQTINLHSVMKKISACCALRDYVRPSLEVVSVVVERGFALSNYWGEGYTDEDRNGHIAKYYGEEYVEEWASKPGADAALGWFLMQLMVLLPRCDLTSSTPRRWVVAMVSRSLATSPTMT